MTDYRRKLHKYWADDDVCDFCHAKTLLPHEGKPDTDRTATLYNVFPRKTATFSTFKAAGVDPPVVMACLKCNRSQRVMSSEHIRNVIRAYVFKYPLASAKVPILQQALSDSAKFDDLVKEIQAEREKTRIEYQARKQFEADSAQPVDEIFRYRSCTRKYRYPSEASAKSAKKKIQSRLSYDGLPLNVYGPCWFCGGWHVGHMAVPTAKNEKSP